ncbi:hypothetical protein ACWGVR_09795 [Streptomyces xanthophaeus]
MARWSSQELLGEGDFVVGPAGVGEGVREGEVGLGDGLLPSVPCCSASAGGEAVAARYLFGDEKYKPNQNPLTCSTPLKKFTTGSSDGWAGGTFAEVNSKGYVSGTSGGPFLIKQGNGRAVAGVTGGWKTGGHSPDTSYSSYFGDEVKRIYDAAVSGKPPDPRSALPPGETWKHAKGIASGYFTVDGDNIDEDRMDMFVMWTDGEVSLYTDVSERGMGAESQVLAADETWKYASEIGSGDYTGNDNWDLIIRWSDGELTNYQDFNGNL